ncbi:hypothetical protein HOLleu_04197 [Holothuria leucospilota]|uniref:Uncharacterized protein n=1 Tax=Holothuria leucospilota TaxID=206669 RepID=A0A9Q1CTJ9_HOLLE|nr:hypothetical protein HOLleu_04197 [Holothuria leucospilota]
MITKIFSFAFCDLDPFPTQLLKDNKILNVIAPTITEIINESFKSRIVPDSMKCAMIKPLLKKALLDCIFSEELSTNTQFVLYF